MQEIVETLAFKQNVVESMVEPMVQMVTNMKDGALLLYVKVIQNVRILVMFVSKVWSVVHAVPKANVYTKKSNW